MKTIGTYVAARIPLDPLSEHLSGNSDLVGPSGWAVEGGIFDQFALEFTMPVIGTAERCHDVLPFFDQTFTFTQPDGSKLEVRGTGDQHQAIFETVDGYTVVPDPISGVWHYAQVSNDGDALIPSGVRPGAALPQSLGLAPRARPTPAAMRGRVLSAGGLLRTPSRWEIRRNERRMALQAVNGDGLITAAPPQRQTVGQFTGLCLLVRFPDVESPILQQEVNAFCNKAGYSGFGNNGSVRDYFLAVSDGKLDYSDIVAPWYTARHPRSYYTNERIPQPQRAVELIKEALTYHKNNGFDFSRLSADSQGYVYAVNVFYAGTRVNNWAKGLWPHSYHLPTPYLLAPGKSAFDYQITDMTDELTLGTFCHENGHIICDFPDLYDYGNESNGVGTFCLMCAGGNADPKNPVQIGAYLKHAAGWASGVKTIANGASVSLKAGMNEFALHRKSAAEYFIVENRSRVKRDAALPDAGLAVWHVDELGSNSNEQMAPSQHYECALVQADGKNELEQRVNYGDAGDLFAAGENDTLTDMTNPSARWWNGQASGLKLTHISAAGPTMTFRVAS